MVTAPQVKTPLAMAQAVGVVGTISMNGNATEYAERLLPSAATHAVFWPGVRVAQPPGMLNPAVLSLNGKVGVAGVPASTKTS